MNLRCFSRGVAEAVEQVEQSPFNHVAAWGYQRDPDFSYLHVGARWYDPATGRFLQRDPIGIIGGPNVCSYVSNSPMTHIDPYGYVPDTNFEYPKPEWTPHKPKPKPKPKPLSPAEELANLNRRIHGAAGFFSLCGGLTWWYPPVSGGFFGAAGAIEVIYWWWAD